MIGWLTPLVTPVLTVNPALWPAITVAVPGAAVMEKSSGGAIAGLNIAIPDAQYIAVLKLPVKVCASTALSARYPVTTLATWDAALVRCGWVVKPGLVTVMACLLACPAMNPTAKAPGTVGVTVPDEGELLDADLPVAASSGLVAATPENSCTLSATTAEDVVRTVTLVTDAALAEYQISPSEL